MPKKKFYKRSSTWAYLEKDPERKAYLLSPEYQKLLKEIEEQDKKLGL